MGVPTGSGSGSGATGTGTSAGSSGTTATAGGSTVGQGSTSGGGGAGSSGAASGATGAGSGAAGAGSAGAGAGTNALSPAVTITTQDDGKTFHVKVSQVVDLALQAAQGMANWEVQNPDPAVLAPTVNPAAAAAQGMTLRAFKSVATGQAVIMATDRPMCNPGVPCPQFIRAFKATVVVDA